MVSIRRALLIGDVNPVVKSVLHVMVEVIQIVSLVRMEPISILYQIGVFYNVKKDILRV
jgi:hypothetical protein